MSDLVGNPEARFSRAEAPIFIYFYSFFHMSYFIFWNKKERLEKSLNTFSLAANNTLKSKTSSFMEFY